MKQQYKAFMSQFEAARKEVDGMPAWMKESAKVATLTYPSIKANAAAASQPLHQQRKKKP